MPAHCPLPAVPAAFPQPLLFSLSDKTKTNKKNAVFQFQKTNAVFVFSFLGANSSWEWLSESLSATTRRGLGSQLRRRQQRTSRQDAYESNATRGVIKMIHRRRHRVQQVGTARASETEALSTAQGAP